MGKPSPRRAGLAGLLSGTRSFYPMLTIPLERIRRSWRLPAAVRIWMPSTICSSETGFRKLKHLCIYMHVGERDVEWLTPIQRQSELLDQKGLRVHFTIEPGEGHGIQTLAGEGAHRLFDQFEQASRGCS